MTGRTLTDEDVDALCDKLCPMIEERLAQRFYANAGRGVIGWLVKIWQPVLIALIIYGLTVAPQLPGVIAGAIKEGAK